MTEDWKLDRIGTALQGTNPTVMARLPSSFAVIGDVQWLPGYSVLLTDDPSVQRLSELAPAARSAYLESVGVLALAVEEVCRELDPAFTRTNIEILGNTDPFLHCHVWPRYSWEPDDIRPGPVWHYPRTHWSEPSHRLGPQHDELRARLTQKLVQAQG